MTSMAVTVMTALMAKGITARTAMTVMTATTAKTPTRLQQLPHNEIYFIESA